MTKKPAPKGYSLGQIRLHWLVAALIVFQIVAHEPMAEAWEAIETGAAPVVSPLVTAHVLAGIAVLILVLWRIALRLGRGAPLPPEGEPELLRRATHWGHLALYGLMVALPLSGLAAWYGGLMAAGEVHEVLKNALLALVLVHVGAAIWHQVWLKDNLLARMKRPQPPQDQP